MTPRDIAWQPCVEGAGYGGLLTLTLSSGDVSSALHGASFALSLKTDVQGKRLSVPHTTTASVQVGLGHVCFRAIAGLQHAGPTGPYFLGMNSTLKSFRLLWNSTSLPTSTSYKP